VIILVPRSLFHSSRDFQDIVLPSFHSHFHFKYRSQYCFILRGFLVGVPVGILIVVTEVLHPLSSLVKAEMIY
jgi:hypothetical protein